MILLAPFVPCCVEVTSSPFSYYSLKLLYLVVIPSHNGKKNTILRPPLFYDCQVIHEIKRRKKNFFFTCCIVILLVLFHSYLGDGDILIVLSYYHIKCLLSSL